MEIILLKYCCGDEEFFRGILFQDSPHETSIKINWKFLSSNYKNEA